jgi:hypothetical protein
MLGREWLSMRMSSGERSRANSEDMIFERPFKVIATSAGVEVRS